MVKIPPEKLEMWRGNYYYAIKRKILDVLNKDPTMSGIRKAHNTTGKTKIRINTKNQGTDLGPELLTKEKII